MEQRFEDLTEDDRRGLQRQRDWMLGHYPSGKSAAYEKFAGKLILIDTILKNGWVKPEETWKLQSLGVSFGDALEQYMGLEWLIVVDESGRDVAMRDPKSSSKVFPLTIISKRVEEGEVVDVVGLFTGICNKISSLRPQG